MTTKYLYEVNEAMQLLAANKDVVFVGQAVEYPGHAITHQVKKLNAPKIEFPVAEEMQAGFCLGLALTGKIPVCIYPRWNFAILAANQIVNHIDKWEELTGSQPHMIIKIAVGSDRPLDPGPQHKANFVYGFKHLLDSVKVVELLAEGQAHTEYYQSKKIYETYRDALEKPRTTIIVEHSEQYATGPLWER
jgi:pyruvate/2-oxoglutarate/acetoin dehydrogenase E1 component